MQKFLTDYLKVSYIPTRFEFRGRKIVGMVKKIAFPPVLTDFNRIQQLWREFNPKISSIPNRIQRSKWEKFGIVFYRASENQFYYVAGVEVKNRDYILSNMESIKIADGMFEKIIHRGPLRDLPNSYQRLEEKFAEIEQYLLTSENKSNVPSYSKNHNSHPVIILLENYSKGFHWNRSNSIISLYIRNFSEKIG